MKFKFDRLKLSCATALASVLLLSSGMANAQSAAQKAVDAAKKMCNGKTITIVPSEDLVIDRSLNADRFQAATGYNPPPWPTLIQRMHDFQ